MVNSIISRMLHYLRRLTMKRISSILAIFLVISTVATVAVSAGAQDDGNSTINNTPPAEPTPDTSASNLSDVTNGTNVPVPPTPTNNGTNATIPPTPTNNGTNVTVPTTPVNNGTNATNATNTTVPLTNSIYISKLDVGASGETANQEYVQITNVGTAAVNMKNWAIKDTGAKHTYLFPAYTSNAKSTVTLRSGTGTNTANTLFWNKLSFIWNNNGDTAYLYNSQGDLVSSRGTNVINGTNGTNGVNGTNGTNGTNVTVIPKPTPGQIVPTVTPKPTPGHIIPAATTQINVVDKTKVIVSQKQTTAKPTVPQTKEVGKVTAVRPIISEEVKKYTNINNEGVKITALHPLSAGVEYVSITNFNDFTAHIEGYKIHEMECNNTIVFKDIDIQPGHTLKIYTGNHQSGSDIVSAKKLRHIYTKNDEVELICACGAQISVFKP